MIFPGKEEFLREFGLEPVEEDSSMALCRYRVRSERRGLEIDISFSAVLESFEVVVYCNGYEIASLVSERVNKIEMRNDSSGSGIRAVFDIQGVRSEAVVNFEPEIACRWWAIRV